MIEVEVSAQVNPTEDYARVRAAIENIFPRLEYQFEERDGMTPRLVGRGDKDCLNMLHELLRSRMILDTARTNLHIEGGIVTFRLNKQAATAGMMSFPADDEPLGSIWVEIRTEDEGATEMVVDWLAPPTEHGHPLYEIEL